MSWAELGLNWPASLNVDERARFHQNSDFLFPFFFLLLSGPSEVVGNGSWCTELRLSIGLRRWNLDVGRNVMNGPDCQ